MHALWLIRASLLAPAQLEDQIQQLLTLKIKAELKLQRAVHEHERAQRDIVMVESQWAGAVERVALLSARIQHTDDEIRASPPSPAEHGESGRATAAATGAAGRDVHLVPAPGSRDAGDGDEDARPAVGGDAQPEGGVIEEEASGDDVAVGDGCAGGGGLGGDGEEGMEEGEALGAGKDSEGESKKKKKRRKKKAPASAASGHNDSVGLVSVS